MTSYYDDLDEVEEVHVIEDHEDGDEEQQEVRCPAHCRNGIVEVHGQETDCITCEGLGTILI